MSSSQYHIRLSLFVSAHRKMKSYISMRQNYREQKSLATRLKKNKKRKDTNIMKKWFTLCLVAMLVICFAVIASANDDSIDMMIRRLFEQTMATSAIDGIGVPEADTNASRCSISKRVNGDYVFEIYGTHSITESSVGTFTPTDNVDSIIVNPTENGHSHSGTLSLQYTDYDYRSGVWICTKSDGTPCGGGYGLHYRQYNGYAMYSGSLLCNN